MPGSDGTKENSAGLSMRKNCVTYTPPDWNDAPCEVRSEPSASWMSRRAMALWSCTFASHSFDSLFCVRDVQAPTASTPMYPDGVVCLT